MNDITAPITLIITGITVLVSWRAFNNQELLLKFMMNPYQVKHRKQYYRILSHGLIHADFIHLLFNMYIFYMFGQMLEPIFTQEEVFQRVLPGTPWWGSAAGVAFYILLYVGAVAFATLPSLKNHSDNPNYNSLGASGAVSAILMAFIVFLPTYPLSLFFIIPMPAFVAGAVFFIAEYYLKKSRMTNIAHDAHIWGGLFGLVFITVLKPQVWVRFFSQVLEYIPWI
ncbi:rhomboid family intramembrane serine protease [Halocola ammonii]